MTGPDNENLSSKDCLLEAVIQGKKPMEFITGSVEVHLDTYESKDPKYVREMKARIERAQASGLPYVINRRTDNMVELAICQKGTVGEHFDIESWLKCYVLYSQKLNYPLLSVADIQYLRGLKNMRLSEFLSDWEYAHPCSNRDLAQTGLLLGYSISSTVACMTANVT